MSVSPEDLKGAKMEYNAALEALDYTYRSRSRLDLLFDVLESLTGNEGVQSCCSLELA